MSANSLKELFEEDWTCSNGHLNGIVTLNGKVELNSVCHMCREPLSNDGVAKVLKHKGLPTGWLDLLHKERRLVEEDFARAGGDLGVIRREAFGDQKQAFLGGQLTALDRFFAWFYGDIREGRQK